MKKQALFAFLLVIIIGCSKTETGDLDDPDTRILIEGYVYAGERVTNVRVSRIHSGGSHVPVKISDAEVMLNQGDFQMQLQADSANPGSYHQSPSVYYLLNDSQRVYLKAKVSGRLYTASVTFPEKITGLEISDTLLYPLPGVAGDTLAYLSWNPVGGAATYCIFIRNISAHYGPLSQVSGYTSVFHRPVFTHSAVLSSADFSFAGKFDIYVTAVQNDYAAMYNTGTGAMDGTWTNIENGSGIFTGFNGDAVSVTVQ